MTRWPALMTCIVLAAMLKLTAIAVQQGQHYSFVAVPNDGKVEELHNVRVLRRIDDYTFQMAVEDQDTHKFNPFAITFCRSYMPTHEIRSGVTLSLLKYEENKQDFCMDVSKDNLGYILLRGENNVPLIADAGQTAAPRQTP